MKKGIATSSIIYSILILFLALITGILGLLGNRKLILDKFKNDVMTKLNGDQVINNLYKDNSGASSPELHDIMIPVIYENGSWVYADVYKKWYDYDLKEWANAVILKDNSINYNVGDIIPESNIDGYFVWVPRYKYEIFNEGNYEGTESFATDLFEPGNKPNVAKTINIVFESKEDSISNGSKVGEYLTHPAFTSLNVNGIWVAKFEPSGSTSDIDVLPNKTSIKRISVKNSFELAYNYNRNLDSHMMKNTEWGAVAYLSHSKYGINDEIRFNNSSTTITGCAATKSALEYVNEGQTALSYSGCENAYNTEIGVLASTTGNITGIYDMSGGLSEYVANYIQSFYGNTGFDDTTISTYGSKYFDIYPYMENTQTHYSNRILGDATGELGPFYRDPNSKLFSSWYGDYAWMPFKNVYFNNAAFYRGGYYDDSVLNGIFYFGSTNGGGASTVTFRLVLD